MIGDDNRIVGVEWFDDAIIGLVVFALGNERAEHLVPGDKDASIIGIQIK